MGEGMDSPQSEKRFNVVKHLSEKFGMPEKEVKAYIGLFHQLFDNLLHLGINIKMDKVLTVEHTRKMIDPYKLGRNKIYIEGLINGDYEKSYVCRKDQRRKAMAKSVTKTTK